MRFFDKLFALVLFVMSYTFTASAGPLEFRTLCEDQGCTPSFIDFSAAGGATPNLYICQRGSGPRNQQCPGRLTNELQGRFREACTAAPHAAVSGFEILAGGRWRTTCSSRLLPRELDPPSGSDSSSSFDGSRSSTSRRSGGR